MRAMFIKDIIILMFFLSSGMTAFTLMAFDMGFDRAFVIPRFRLPEELIGSWIVWGLLFGWAMGATDQIRGLTDYISHRGFSKARLYWTQHSLGLGVIAVSLTTPWILLAIFGGGLYEPDYWGIGSSWLLASTIVLPCYGVGVFLANVPFHPVFRVALTFPLMFWIVGEMPDRILELGMTLHPGNLAAQFIPVGLLLLIAGYLGMRANRDRDLPTPGTSFLPILVLLISMGWSLHAIQAMLMQELTQGMDQLRVTERPDGTFTRFESEYDLESGESTHWEVGQEGTKQTIPIDELSPVGLARRHRRQSGFSGSSRDYLRSGSGIAGNVRRVSAYVSMEGKGILHLVERDIYNGTKVYLEKSDGPFSNLTRLFEPHRSNMRPLIWAGDPSDGTAWYADFGQKDWKYVALELPGEDRFEEWLEPQSESGLRLAKEISGQDPRDRSFRLAFMKTTGGIAYVDRDSKRVTRLTEEQVRLAEEADTGPTVPLLYVSSPSLLFPKNEVRSPNGDVLFSYQFTPSSPRELWKASLTALASIMHPPALAPKAFGNITHVQKGGTPYSMHGIDPLQDPIRYTSMKALSLANLEWTDFSAWSLIAWVLLLALTLRIRIYLVQLGATGARLWLWPLAVLCFGILGALMCVITERRRAYLPAVVDLHGKRPEPLLKSA